MRFGVVVCSHFFRYYFGQCHCHCDESYLVHHISLCVVIFRPEKMNIVLNHFEEFSLFTLSLSLSLRKAFTHESKGGLNCNFIFFFFTKLLNFGMIVMMEVYAAML